MSRCTRNFIILGLFCLITLQCVKSNNADYASLRNSRANDNPDAPILRFPYSNPNSQNSLPPFFLPSRIVSHATAVFEAHEWTEVLRVVGIIIGTTTIFLALHSTGKGSGIVSFVFLAFFIDDLREVYYANLAVIFGGLLHDAVSLLRTKHQLTGLPLVDMNLLKLMMPMLSVGTSIGFMARRLPVSNHIELFFVFLSALLAIRYFFASVSTYRLESYVRQSSVFSEIPLHYPQGEMGQMDTFNDMQNNLNSVDAHHRVFDRTFIVGDSLVAPQNETVAAAQMDRSEGSPLCTDSEMRIEPSNDKETEKTEIKSVAVLNDGVNIEPNEENSLKLKSSRTENNNNASNNKTHFIRSNPHIQEASEDISKSKNPNFFGQVQQVEIQDSFRHQDRLLHDQVRDRGEIGLSSVNMSTRQFTPLTPITSNPPPIELTKSEVLFDMVTILWYPLILLTLLTIRMYKSSLGHTSYLICNVLLATLFSVGVFSFIYESIKLINPLSTFSPTRAPTLGNNVRNIPNQWFQNLDSFWLARPPSLDDMHSGLLNREGGGTAIGTIYRDMQVGYDVGVPTLTWHWSAKNCIVVGISSFVGGVCSGFMGVESSVILMPLMWNLEIDRNVVQASVVSSAFIPVFIVYFAALMSSRYSAFFLFISLYALICAPVSGFVSSKFQIVTGRYSSEFIILTFSLTITSAAALYLYFVN